MSSIEQSSSKEMLNKPCTIYDGIDMTPIEDNWKPARHLHQQLSARYKQQLHKKDEKQTMR